MAKDKISVVIWKDASTLEVENKAWHTKEEALEMAKEQYEENSKTVGFVLENNDKYVVIASTKNDGTYSDINLIPKKFVIKINAKA
jgi:hypothetical protein